MAAVSPAAAAAQKLQLLADSLAAGFNQSQAAAPCGAALKRLLPGLQNLSIALTNPGPGSSIVVSGNHATAGLTTLNLHDALSSAVGQALARGCPLHASLAGATSAATAASALALTDVQQMVAQSPAVTHVLCVPFGCHEGGGGGGAAGAADGRQSRACQCTGTPCRCHHTTAPWIDCGRASGALLFGLSVPPLLDARRLTLLGLLADCLPAPMARLSADTLAFVNHSCGGRLSCGCFGLVDSSDSEEEKIGCICTAGFHSSHSSGTGASTGQLPLAAREAGMSHGSSSEALNDAYWLAERDALTVAGEGTNTGFSKGGLALAEAGDDDFGSHHRWSLTFSSELLEREYVKWTARQILKADKLSCLLLLFAVAIIAFGQPYRLVEYASGAVVLGIGCALPLAFNWLNTDAYKHWRFHVMATYRLYIVAFCTLVCIRSFQSRLPPERTPHWTAYLRLTGAEALLFNASGFMIRLRLHVPLQLIATGVAAWNLPMMCSECYPGMAPATCVFQSAVRLIVVGFLLPTLILHNIEQRSRATFTRLLRVAAMHSS